ncbi:MAG: hypothetical protein D6785_00105 [Planctomycetota bacterium]|nr:MAG: hypothetical protein D6785_00105 [Planctomycetota bacterium]
MNPTKDNKKAVVLVFKGKGMGITNAQELKEKLANTFLTLLSGSNTLPKAICFYTDGVHLICQGSPILDILKDLEEKGVTLIACKTCLDYFNILDKVEVGIVGGMPDIISALWQADLVIEV